MLLCVVNIPQTWLAQDRGGLKATDSKDTFGAPCISQLILTLSLSWRNSDKQEFTVYGWLGWMAKPLQSCVFARPKHRVCSLRCFGRFSYNCDIKLPTVMKSTSWFIPSGCVALAVLIRLTCHCSWPDNISTHCSSEVSPGQLLCGQFFLFSFCACHCDACNDATLITVCSWSHQELLLLSWFIFTWTINQGVRLTNEHNYRTGNYCIRWMCLCVCSCICYKVSTKILILLAKWGHFWSIRSFWVVPTILKVCLRVKTCLSPLRWTYVNICMCWYFDTQSDLFLMLTLQEQTGYLWTGINTDWGPWQSCNKLRWVNLGWRLLLDGWFRRLRRKVGSWRDTAVDSTFPLNDRL